MSAPDRTAPLETPAWTQWLGHPRWALLCMGLALLLGLPSIGLGISADDLLQRLVLLDQWPFGEGSDPLFDLFSFMPGTTDGLVHERAMGLLPWWADPEISATFFRPISVLTHMLDYALWPDRFWLQHIHSLLWYSASVGLVVHAFRRFGLALPLAGLAGLFFAFEDAHALTAGWLANRNASVCMVFGLASMCLHHRWRTEGRVLSGAAAVLCFALSLLSAEAGVGALAYLAAWQLVMDDQRWTVRLRALLPYLVVLVAWRLVYQHMGYGVRWSDVYIDPGRQPLRFAVALVERVPLMMTAQWFQAPIDGTNLLSVAERAAVAGLTWFLTLGLLHWLSPLLRARREARFWALGMGLSIIPICAAFPMSRVLTFTGLGAFALLALQMESWLDGRAPLGRAQRLLLWLHIPCSGAVLVAGPFFWFVLLEVLLPTAQLPDDLTPEQTIVLLQTHDLAGASLSVASFVHGEAAAPSPVAMLGSLLSDVRVRRLDAQTLELETRGGWNRIPMERLTRSIERPWQVGDAVEMTGYTIEIRQITEDGRPQVVEATFSVPLEDPGLRWFVYEGFQLVEWAPLAAGEELWLPAIGS